MKTTGLATLACIVLVTTTTAQTVRTKRLDFLNARTKASVVEPQVENPDLSPAGESTQPASSDSVSTTDTTEPPRAATFTVRASELGAGRWNPTSMKAQAGQWVLVEVTTIDDLRDTKDTRAKAPRIYFKMQDQDKPSCSVSFGRTDKAGQTRKTAIKVSSDDRVQYATEGKFSVKVNMTLSDTQPESITLANDDDALGAGGTTAGDTSTLPCPQCHGTGTRTDRIDSPSGRRSATVRSSCALCKGTGRCGQRDADWYRKSVIWAAENTP